MRERTDVQGLGYHSAVIVVLSLCASVQLQFYGLHLKRCPSQDLILTHLLLFSAPFGAKAAALWTLGVVRGAGYRDTLLLWVPWGPLGPP